MPRLSLAVQIDKQRERERERHTDIDRQDRQAVWKRVRQQRVRKADRQFGR